MNKDETQKRFSFKPKKTIAACLILLLLLIFGAALGPLLSPYSGAEISKAQFQPPCLAHWFGTDINGRDLLTRILEGARISLLVGFAGASISLTLGTAYGIVSGYLGGRIDNAMMRFVDILYSLPRIIVVIVLIAIFDEYTKTLIEQFGWRELVQHSRILLLFMGLGLVQWLTMARIVRGQVLVLRERAFIRASQALGQSPIKIMWKHLLPNLLGIILVYLTLTIPTVILEESFLSFLGLGVQAPNSSWGTLLADGAKLVNPLKIYWWLLLGPAVFMSVTLLALNFLGDALRDYFDPAKTR